MKTTLLVLMSFLSLSTFANNVTLENIVGDYTGTWVDNQECSVKIESKKRGKYVKITIITKTEDGTLHMGTETAELLKNINTVRNGGDIGDPALGYDERFKWPEMKALIGEISNNPENTFDELLIRFEDENLLGKVNTYIVACQNMVKTK